MTLTPPVRTVQPVLGNTCPKCLERMLRGSKVVYFRLPDCECKFPVPNAKVWYSDKDERVHVSYSQEQKRLDLEFLEQYEQLTCSVALANGLISGWECQEQERRIERMRQKCRGMAMAAMNTNADRQADSHPSERRLAAAASGRMAGKFGDTT